MSFFKNAFQKLKDKVFGGGVAAVPDATPVELDFGPAKKWYIKSLFHRSIFTKKMTPSREKEIRAVFRQLRPEQKVIARKHGWNRGLDV